MTITGTNGTEGLWRDSAAPWPGPRGDVERLASEEVEVRVAPEDGCRIVSLRAHGHEVLRQWRPGRGAFQYGAFPMVPWVGRLGGGLLYHDGFTYQLPVNRPPHALHGLACFAPWERTAEGVYSRAIGKPWPWVGTVEQRIAVNGPSVVIGLTVASDRDVFPAQAGWHPWFLKSLAGAPGEATFETTADWQEELGGNELPTGWRIPVQPGPWDDCFGFDGGMSARLRWGQLSLEITSNGSWMTVFDRLDDAICVEPLTGAPNGINTRPALVAPDRPLTIETTWSFSRQS